MPENKKITQKQVNEQYIMACIRKDLPLVQSLVDQGIGGKKVKFTYDLISKFFILAEQNATDIISYLLTHPEHKDKFNSELRSAFLTACKWGHVETVSYFMASPELQNHLSNKSNQILSYDNYGVRVLFSSNHKKCVDFLLQNFNPQDPKYLEEYFDLATLAALTEGHIELCAYTINHMGLSKPRDIDPTQLKRSTIMSIDNGLVFDFLLNPKPPELTKKYPALEHLVGFDFEENKKEILMATIEHSALECFNVLLNNSKSRPYLSAEDFNFSLISHMIDYNSQIFITQLLKHGLISTATQKEIIEYAKTVQGHEYYQTKWKEVAIEVEKSLLTQEIKAPLHIEKILIKQKI